MSLIEVSREDVAIISNNSAELVHLQLCMVEVANAGILGRHGDMQICDTRLR